MSAPLPIPPPVPVTPGVDPLPGTVRDDGFVPGTRRPRRKSYLLAYLLWAVLGWLGAHRYYAGKWFTGLLYTGTFGLLFFGWLADFFLLFFMIREQRRRAASGEAVPVSPWRALLFDSQAESAPWAARRNPADILDLSLRALLYLIGPALVFYIAYLLELIELAILVILIMALAGLLGPLRKNLAHLDRLFQDFPSLGRMPFAADVLGTIKSFNDFYYEHKPAGVIYYLFYPIFGVLSLPFSKRARKEFRLFQTVIMIAFVTVVLDTLLGFEDRFLPYLNLGNAIQASLVLVAVAAVMLPVVIMPTVTTAFRLKYAGHTNWLRVLTVLSGFLLVYAINDVLRDEEQINQPAQYRLELKMDVGDFRSDLLEQTNMFLGYYAPRLEPAAANGSIVLDAALTEDYQRHLRGILPDEHERRAFGVLRFEGGIPGESWFVARYRVAGTEVRPLIAFGPSGLPVTQWEALPNALRGAFVSVALEDPMVAEAEDWAPEWITTTRLIDD